jgi:hypothetical protein
LFYSDGGWQGIRLIAGVDFILGPILTLFLFNPLKPKRFQDMAVILIIQFCALFYGIYTVYQERPVALIYHGDVIITLTKNNLLFPSDGQDQFNKIPGPLPKNVLAILPDGVSPFHQLFDTRYLYPVENHVAEALSKSYTTKIFEKAPDLPEKPLIEAWLQKTKMSPEDVRFLRFHSRYEPEKIVAVDRETAKILKVF